MIDPVLAATSVTLDVALISGIITLLSISISVIWATFQIKQKLESQDEALKNLILENRELINDLRRDSYYAVCSLKEQIEELQQFLSQPNAHDRTFNIRQRSGLPPEGFLKNNNKNS